MRSADANADAPTCGTPPSRRAAASFDVLIILLVFFVAAAYPVPDVNEPHYLCKAKHYWNPAWCAHDFFLNSADAHLTFYWTSGWLTRWFPLPAVAWIGRLATWGLLAWAWRRLSVALVPRPLYAPLSAALWVMLMTYFHLAGEWIVGGFEAKGLAFVFVLLAIEAVVRGRWNRAWLLVGIATSLHVLVGGWSLLLIGWTWLTEGDSRPPVAAIAPGLAAGAVASLPGLVPALLLTRNVDPEIVRQANVIYVFFRLPHHLALYALKTPELVERITRFAPQVLLLIGLCYLVPSTPPRRRLWQFAFGSLLIAWLGFCISLVTWNQPELAAGILRYYWYRMADIAVPMGIALSVTIAIAHGLAPSTDARSAGSDARRHSAPPAAAMGAVWLLALSLVFAGYLLGKTLVLRHQDPRPRADKKMRDVAAWWDVCRWVAGNTPEGAIFLVPRQAQTFKWWTGRAEVANYKDVPQDARSLVEWWQRIDDLYRYTDTEGRRRYRRTLAEQGEQHLRAIADRYAASYLVTERPPRLNFEMLYGNRRYAVYRLAASPPHPPPARHP